MSSSSNFSRVGHADAQLEVSVTHSGSGAGIPSPTVTPSPTPNPMSPTVTECQSELWAATPGMDSELGLD